MDAAPLIGFLFFQGIFTAAANCDAVFFKESLGAIIPTSTLLLTIVFAIGTPLGLFRGPLSVFGVGPVTFAVINSLGVFQIPFLFAVFQFTGIATTISSSVTQSWNIWAHQLHPRFPPRTSCSPRSRGAGSPTSSTWLSSLSVSADLT